MQRMTTTENVSKRFCLLHASVTDRQNWTALCKILFTEKRGEVHQFGENIAVICLRHYNYLEQNSQLARFLSEAGVQTRQVSQSQRQQEGGKNWSQLLPFSLYGRPCSRQDYNGMYWSAKVVR